MTTPFPSQYLLLVPLCMMAFITTATSEEAICLKHDVDGQDDKRSMSGAGHAVRFTCPDDEKWYITAVSIHGARYGTRRAPRDKFRIQIANADLTAQIESRHRYSLFERGAEKWVRFKIAPVEVQGEFRVAAFFDPTRTKGVYVGIDRDSESSHSTSISASESNSEGQPLEGNWMMRVYVAKTVNGKPKTLADSSTRAQQRLEQEVANDAAILGEARSVTLSHAASSSAEHMNIQGALYTMAFETPQDVDAYVWQVQLYASQFGGRHDSEAVSADVYILDENRRVISRTTFPYSLLTQEKQWVSVSTLPTKVQGHFYVSIDAHGTKYKGVYMGFEDGNPDGRASTDELADDHVQPGDWSEKFNHMQWMIRVKVADRPVVY